MSDSFSHPVSLSSSIKHTQNLSFKACFIFTKWKLHCSVHCKIFIVKWITGALRRPWVYCSRCFIWLRSWTWSLQSSGPERDVFPWLEEEKEEQWCTRIISRMCVYIYYIHIYIQRRLGESLSQSLLVAIHVDSTMWEEREGFSEDSMETPAKPWSV